MRQYFMMTDAPPFPLSRHFDLARLGDAAQEVTIDADAEARAAIARQFGIPAVEALSGRFHISRIGPDQAEARLELAARVIQSCVVSLEPVEQTIAERTSFRLLSGGEPDDAGSLDPDAPDDIVADGTVFDLGALLVEQLALALDPYPRRPGAEPPAASGTGAKDEAHPFAALARLRRPN
ncbi:hypothetical protein ACIDI_62c00070 [Acidiphilium sp. JA12-A1]|nr:hypothetical protein ACIDI_62c00070 [Acidiphilium sp. JA12-A1]